MKPTILNYGLSLLAGPLALVCALGATSTYAQIESVFYHPLTLAPADATSSGGGGAGGGRG